jgi:hypothetical protein
VPEPIRWRLEFDIHPDVTEPDDGASIAVAAPEWRAHTATNLILVDRAGAGVIRLPLDDDGGGWKPIFYRRRSLTLDGSGQGHLDAIVFGRQRSTLSQVDAQLWLLGHDGYARDCPEELIDPTAIANLDGLF